MHSMSSFFSSIADKAQSAIHSTYPSKDKHPTVHAIQHQIRAFGQQYNYTSATPVQKIITAEKSLSLDFDSASRNAKYQSKELYTWGQNETDDLRDVTDRLAYFNFVQGSLANDLAVKLDAARAPFKALRDAETAIAPRRNIRAGLKLELSRIEHSQQKGLERKMVELKEQIKKADLDDEPQEKEIEVLKRKAVRESEQLKWDAFREYAEKLSLLSQASALVTAALPPFPPSATRPYTGTEATGAARASLQHALDNYKPGATDLPPQLTGADLHRSDTRSFGESHASELSTMTSDTTHSSSTASPLVSHHALPSQSLEPVNSSKATPAASSTGIDALDPTTSAPHQPAASSSAELSSSSSHNPDTNTKTHASPESADGGKTNDSNLTFGVPSETSPAPAVPSKFESAEEEKQRLEREERERDSKSESTTSGTEKKDGDEDLPPQYQDI